MMRRTLLVVLAWAVILGLALVTARHDAHERAGRSERTLAGIARRLVRAAEAQSALTDRLGGMWRRVLRRSVADPGLDAAVAAWRARHGGRACEVWLFDVAGRPVLGAPRPRESARQWAAAAVYARACRPWWVGEPGRYESATAARSIYQDLNVVNRLRDRPDLVRRIVPLGRCSWLAWQRDAAVTHSGQVAGALVFWHRERMSPRAPLLWRLHRLRAAGLPLGYVVRRNTARICPPPGVAAEVVAAAVGRWRDGGENIQHIADGRLVLTAIDRQFLLVAWAPREPWRLAPGWLALLAFVPWAGLRLVSVVRGRRVGLHWVLCGLLVVAAGLPLIVTLSFWRHFAASRTDSVVTSALQDMTGRLIEIDGRMPMQGRMIRRRFAQMLRTEVGPDWDGASATLRPLLAALAAGERRAWYDFALVIDEQGRHLREFTTLNVDVGAAALLPHAERPRVVREMLACGYPFLQDEIDLVKTWPEGRTDVAPRWFYRRAEPAIDRNIADTAAGLGRDLIRRANAGIGQDGDSEGATALVVGSVVESSAGDTARQLAARLGDLWELGSGERTSRIYFDVVRDRDGRARCFLMVFHDYVLLQRLFLEPLFGPTAPALSFELAAVSNFTVNQFPDHAAWLRFGPLQGQMPPGVNRLAFVHRPRDGPPQLVAAVVARHARNYLLVGTRPWSVVEAQVRPLLHELVMAGLAMTVLLILLGVRLAMVLVAPARGLLAGVTAMARRELTHRIGLGAGDEWDELARAFNKTLDDMRELEVARVVQERLLPAAPIVAGPVSYRGRSVMTSSIGGDFYDAAVLPDGRVAFMLGDVSGHGVSAALVVAMVKAGFEAAVRAGITTPGALLDRLSRLLIMHVKKVKMMTAVAGVMAPDGTLLLANAGHPWPVVTHADGRCELVRETSFPLGTILRKKYKDHTLCLARGSRLVLYSDGVSEGLDPDGNYFTIERVETAVGMLRARDPDGMIAELLQNLARFTREEPWHDDVSFGVLALD